MPKVNKKVLVKIKDKLYGEAMREMVGLKSKMYATDIESEEQRNKKLEIKKSKRVREFMVDVRITNIVCSIRKRR